MPAASGALETVPRLVGSVQECVLACTMVTQCMAVNINMTLFSIHGDKMTCIMLPSINVGEMWLEREGRQVYAHKGRFGQNPFSVTHTSD